MMQTEALPVGPVPCSCSVAELGTSGFAGGIPQDQKTLDPKMTKLSFRRSMSYAGLRVRMTDKEAGSQLER